MEKSVSLFIGKLDDTSRRVGLNHSFKVSRVVDRGESKDSEHNSFCINLAFLILFSN